eukprot:5771184-Pyramimonas_sp.AAC.1
MTIQVSPQWARKTSRETTTARYVAAELPAPHQIVREPALAVLVRAAFSARILLMRGPQVARQGRRRERAPPQGRNVCGETRLNMICLLYTSPSARDRSLS